MQHIVRELKKAPTQVRQEYNRFKNVWQRYVLRTRQLQSLYEAFAAAALYGHNSDTCNVWLQEVAPALHARVNEMPDPAGNGDCGLSYMIEVMSRGLVEAAEDMAGEKVGGYFSTINMGPRAALALMSKKRGLEENEPSSRKGAECAVSMRGVGLNGRARDLPGAPEHVAAVGRARDHLERGRARRLALVRDV